MEIMQCTNTGGSCYESQLHNDLGYALVRLKPWDYIERQTIDRLSSDGDVRRLLTVESLLRSPVCK
jgi:hypothetical protein